MVGIFLFVFVLVWFSLGFCLGWCFVLFSISCYRAELLLLGPHVSGYHCLEWCVIPFEETVKEEMM